METLQLAGFIGIGFVVALVVISVMVASLYRKASKERAFVRTGLGGQKVIINGGKMVFPVIHEVTWINMNTLRLEVRRANEQALITRDRMRVDVTAEFYVRVKPTEDAIADAAQTLGQRTMQPDSLKELIEGKFVDSLRAVAAEMGMEELHEKRAEFVQRVQTTVSEDLLKNGLELESVSLTSLDQTSQEFFNPQNAFDAQGLTRLTEQIETRRKQRNDIEQEMRIQIEQRNLEADQLSLKIKKEQEYARLEQEREVEITRAAQATEIAKERADKTRAAREAEIVAQRDVQQAEILAKQELDQKRILADQQVREKEIAMAKAVEAAEIEKRKLIELNEQDKAIAIAERSKSQSEMEAQAAQARAERVRAEEQVLTVQEVEIAERKKKIEIVQASEEAEREAIKLKVAAEAEVQASRDRAAAIRTVAEGEAEAEKLRAMAKEALYAVEASGKRAINEAENTLSPEIIAMHVKRALIEALPEIIRESVKPMERIDSIKIMHVEGLSGGGGNGEVASSGDGSLADQMVNSALRYRSQAPMVDAVLRELGLQNGDLSSLSTDVVKSVVETSNGTAAVKPVKAVTPTDGDTAKAP
ncbi:MAG TPA: flotillin domain-containing protein [Fimbriimonadaceae bacterium]|nr:flotillin [Armatimonadota bacterium]HCM72651.1 flotillin [Armatimonadota bacterium]HRD30600.1 flotillin domain-containing protein [Fimbriimonadaceae bacterium]HRE92739.1 flotillin domain-containing protein [Fimbriimonadaceae bacterium]HRI74054.1 flotillin domain-containing protein [Fimbriimonadaceae bacterium]